MSNINLLRGVSARDAQQLSEVGVCTTDQLLERGATSSGRMRLADLSRLSDETIKNWVHQADLMRVRGVRADLADLLCRLNVTTLPKFAYSSARQLYNELRSMRDTKVHLPTRSELEQLIAEAKRLPKIVRH